MNEIISKLASIAIHTCIDFLSHKVREFILVTFNECRKSDFRFLPMGENFYMAVYIALGFGRCCGKEYYIRDYSVLSLFVIGCEI